jgi:hypothetical protein
MPLFYLQFKLLDHARSDCMTLFAGMNQEDDKAEMGDDIKLIGRWSTLGEGAGFCICEAKDASTLANWLVSWTPMVTIKTTPILDDNQARAVILKSEPPFVVDYSKVGDEAAENESLYFIQYKFKEDCKAKGFATFAGLTQEQDAADSGNNTCMGRWHNLGTGTGVAICSSASESDLFAWAYNWKDMCDCVVTPVVSDKEFRRIMQNKPDFWAKHAALMDKMKPKRKSYFFG